uniref:helix-turn-helix domain-containing protein n=1 Tax=Rheinheimera sp. TaxID=1869214 RepID=UPI004048A52C
MVSNNINFTSDSVSPLEINYALRKAGFSQARIARVLEVSPSTVSSVINGKASSYQVARFIADKLNTSVNCLWPDRYVFKPRGAKAMHS